jgi:hypothetical protein
MIENFITKDFPGFSNGLKESHARGGRLLAVGYLLEVGNAGRQEGRPAVSGRRRILVEKAIGCHLHGGPRTAHKNGEYDDKPSDIASYGAFGKRRH